VNPYLAFAAVIAGGLHGIQAGLTLNAPFDGNAYLATDVGRIPWNIVDAIELFENSSVAKSAFGDDVHHHLLTTARHE
jgi:glutamine synthetase